MENMSRSRELVAAGEETEEMPVGASPMRCTTTVDALPTGTELVSFSRRRMQRSMSRRGRFEFEKLEAVRRFGSAKRKAKRSGL